MPEPKYRRKRYNRYKVISSSIPDVPVGTLLIDYKNTTVADWTYLNNKMETVGTVTGIKIDRVCVECLNLGYGKPYRHQGDHGKDAPDLPDPDLCEGSRRLDD